MKHFAALPLTERKPRYSLAFLAALGVLAVIPLSAADHPASYLPGKAACAAGAYGDCEKAMREALAKNSRSDAKSGYFPFYYLGLAAYNQGKTGLANACFDREAALGTINGSPLYGTMNGLRRILSEQHIPEGNYAPCAGKMTPASAPVAVNAPASAPVALLPPNRPAPGKSMPPLIDGGPSYPWAEQYHLGQAACARGDWEDCRGAMARALTSRADSGLQLRSGPDLVDYTPHYFIALANYNLQDEAAAAYALEKEAGYGVIQKTAYAGAFQTLVKAILNPSQAKPVPGVLARPDESPGEPAPTAPPLTPEPAATGPADPAGAQADYVKGVTLVLQENCPAALPMFESALRKDPRPRQWTRSYGMWFEPYLPHYYLASCYYQLGKFDDARRHIRLSQDREMRGRLSDQSGKLLDLSQSIDQREAGGQTALLYNLGEGIMRLVSGDYDRSAIVFEFLTQASPRWAEAHLYLGMSYFGQSEKIREGKEPDAQKKAEELRVLARKEFKAARKFDRKISLSKLMLSPSLTDFWNSAVH